MGERSEGATIQLTTCGVGPKACKSQHWCVSSQSCMQRPRRPRCAAASQGHLRHHSSSSSVCVFAPHTCGCPLIYKDTESTCVSLYVCVCFCPCTCFTGCLPKLAVWLTGPGLILCYRSSCTNNMVAYPQCVIITPK